ncbi:LuxR C-terminal-related transcriptional regulator [Sulfobacillus thermosulfidooxidans]|uniref:LuxR C-terminal-related transcriptional regulator n=1 Tax=Sulfobacillus thermosulfidooxidans TaxID=28034 RepID=UPI0002F65142|nr:LuxR C-terminal-related transcriptional regulator [Sulfobacillus thermosulfidooxidans]
MAKAEITDDPIHVALLVSCELENEGLYHVINAHSDMITCCQWIVHDSHEVLNTFSSEAVDVAVMMLPWTILGELLKGIHQKFPNMGVIVISKGPLHWSDIVRMLNYGVVGLTRSMQASVIVSMIRLAYYRAGSIDVEMARRMASALQETRYSRNSALTFLDHKIWSLIVRGYSNPQIAQHCGISLSRTKHRIHHIFRYLGVRNRASAIAMYKTYNAFNTTLDMELLGSADNVSENCALLHAKKCRIPKTTRESSK